MATAILDFELQKIPERISGIAERYERAVVLGRFRGRPVARVDVPVRDGRIQGQFLRDELLRAIDPNLWQELFAESLQPQDSERQNCSATIAICTRDRVDDLKKCLDSLQRLPDDGQEVLVIDNSPTSDATSRLVQQYPQIRYVREDRPGLDCARNRAIREANHEIVAFIDDDAVADPDWLRTLLKNFSDPMVACVTGLTMPLELETEAQEWFEKYCPFTRGFRRRIFRPDEHNPHVTGQIGAGVNMAVRRKSIFEIGLFDEALDAGTKTQSGGDHEIFTRILLAGYSIVYEPAALNWHRHRRTWNDLRKTLHGYGVGVYALLTRALLVEREWPALKIAWGWFRYEQFPGLLQALRKKADGRPLDLLLAELKGCLAGPRAYLVSRKRSTNSIST